MVDVKWVNTSRWKSAWRQTARVGVIAALLFSISRATAAESFSDFLKQDNQAFKQWHRSGEPPATNGVQNAAERSRPSGQPVQKTVKYQGRADYDGCPAALELNFDGNPVSR